MSWVLQQADVQVSELVMCSAASKGDVAMCQYLRAQQCPWDAEVARRTASTGHVDLLRWLMDNGCPYNADELCSYATAYGRVEVLVCLQQQCLLTSAAMLTAVLDFAGTFHQLAAAQWLREQGAEWPAAFLCPWSGAVLAWARAEGCTTPIN
jgi:hypothetical protein